MAYNTLDTSSTQRITIMRKMTDEQNLDMVNKYISGQFNCASLARIYGVTKACIRQKLLRRGIKIVYDHSKTVRKYDFDFNFFETINTEAKAYFLGLLFADGYNHNIRNTIVLSLQERDVELLNMLSSQISYTGKLFYENRKIKKPKWQNQYKLMLNSSKLKADLTRLGCTNKKSLTLKFPTEKQVPSHLMNHFVRGYFDGDGTIGFYHPTKHPNQTKCSARVVSSCYFIDGLRTLILRELGVDGHALISKPKSNNQITTVLNFQSRKKALPFLEWIYENANFYLKRKYDLYIKIKNFSSYNSYHNEQ